MRALAVLVVAILLAGCAAAAPSGTPEERAKRAAESLARSILADGDLVKLEGSVSAQGQTGTLSVEFGTGGATLVRLNFGGLVAVTLYCDATRTISVFGNTSVEARRGGTCDESKRNAPLNLSETPDIVDAKASGNGGVSATLKPAGNGTGPLIQVQIDRRDRVTDVTFDDGASHAQLHLSYGKRGALTPPTAKDRMPAQVESTESFADEYAWTVSDAKDHAPWSDLTVNVLQGSGGSLAASFAASVSTSHDGFTYTLHDVAADGRVDVGDSFTISGPTWTHRYDFRVEVFDNWAGHNIGDGPRIPGFSVLVGLIAAAVVVDGRRRRLA